MKKTQEESKKVTEIIDKFQEQLIKNVQDLKTNIPLDVTP